MSTPYDTDLDRNAANFQPLTPLSFLARAAEVYPDTPAIIHGGLSRNYREFYARAKRLASALARRGVKRGDTVSVMLANTPAMIEAHYGVPMTGAVLNTLNTRLDAAILGFTLDHAETKVLIVDREHSKVMKDALARAKVRPLVIDYDDPEYGGAGERIGSTEYEDFLREGDRGFRLADAERRMGRHLAQLYLRHHRRSQGRRLSPSRRLFARARQRHHLRHGQAPGLFVDLADVSLQRLVLSMDVVDRRRHARLLARRARGADLQRHRRLQGYASVWRADRDVDAAQCAGAGEETVAACRSVRDRGRAAAGGGAGGDEGCGFQRHASLRTDRDLRPREHQRMARRVGSAGAGRPGGQEGPPGRALSGARGARCAQPRNHAAGTARQRRRSARSCSAATW